MRGLVNDVVLSPAKFIQPLFVAQGLAQKQAVPGLTGVYRETPETLLQQIDSDLENGVKSFLLFGVPEHKAKDRFSFDFNANQITAIKKRFGADVFLSVDVCLCSATEHGQCGILNESGTEVLNSETVSVLTRAAVQYAQSGADCIAPSDMMDGRIGAIREALNEAQLHHTLLLSYAAKFHSKFYGPFRVAADSAPKGSGTLKDRATYQIDPGNFKDALACSKRDLAEGADWLMVKPGMPYLDVLYRLSHEIECPWAVYEVSGEFAAIELMAEQGLMSREAAHLEAWTGFFRAGASMVISYGARSVQGWMKKEKL